MRSFRLQSFGEPLVATTGARPQPAGTEVVLEVAACGVCHTDVHLCDGYYDLGDGEQLDVRAALAPPRTLGHEIAGTVVAVGPEVTDVRAGDRRVVYPWIGCGTCALCRAGDEHLCSRGAGIGVQRDGGFAQAVVVPHPKYLFEYAPLSSEQACTYACSGLTAYSALKKVPPRAPDDVLLVIGAGGVGLSGIRFARALYGIAPVVAEVNRAKWDDARAAGAADVLDPSAGGALRAFVKSTGGGAATVVDFVGAGASFAFGLGALRKAGRMVSVGLYGGSAKISPPLLSMKAVSIAGSYVGSLSEMWELMQLARSGAVADLVVSARPLSDVNAALVDLRAGNARGRIVVVPQAAAAGGLSTQRQGDG